MDRTQEGVFHESRQCFVIPLALLASAAARAAPQPDPLEQELIAMERQSWVAWQRHDVAFWEHFLSDDHVEIQLGGGWTGKRQVIAGIAGGSCTVASWEVDQFTFRRLGRNTAMLIYRAAQDTHCGNFTVPSPSLATSLYQRRHGRWENVLYVHTPMARPRPS
jgi:hypothetical protein